MKKGKVRHNTTKLPFQSLSGTINARNFRKSHFYREELVPLVGKEAVITGKMVEIKKTKIYGRWVKRFLLRNMTVLKTEGEQKDYGKTSHIWIICESDFLSRNHFKEGTFPVLSGYFYEYMRRDSYGNKLRNIGFCLNSIWTQEEYEKRGEIV